MAASSSPIETIASIASYSPTVKFEHLRRIHSHLWYVCGCTCHAMNMYRFSKVFTLSSERHTFFSISRPKMVAIESISANICVSSHSSRVCLLLTLTGSVFRGIYLKDSKCVASRHFAFPRMRCFPIWKLFQREEEERENVFVF